MTDDAKASPNRSLLSDKNIPVDERLILALDVPTVPDAKALVERLGDTVVFYKLGLEIFMAGGYYELIDWMRARGKRVFVDLKFFDVPATVKSAVRQLNGRGVSFATVHGNDAILRAAAETKGDVRILAVTVLTSLDQADIESLGFQCRTEDLVFSRAQRALEIGCDGVISSGWEAARLRENLGSRFLVVVPGIRPVRNTTDDQKRTVDLEEAFLKGADHVVVGRPIRQATDPAATAQALQERIGQLFTRSR